MYRLVLACALFGVVFSRDFHVGTREFGNKIFDEDRTAGAFLWRRSTDVKVTADAGEVISGVYVKDRRSCRDGVVEIVDGGERQRTVVIRLKSPSIFKGYDFHVEVYSQPDFQSGAAPASTAAPPAVLPPVTAIVDAEVITENANL